MNITDINKISKKMSVNEHLSSRILVGFLCHDEDDDDSYNGNEDNDDYKDDDGGDNRIMTIRSTL